MAGGGLVQLVAYGAQDVYLTGNPQITFFKVVYRRHTNFASESIEQTFTGTFSFGSRVTVQLTRNADVVTKMYLRVVLNQGLLANVTVAGGQSFTPQWAWVRNVGHALINDYYLEIGGTQIDKQYGDWLNIWYELTHPVGQVRGYAKMVGNVPAMTSLTNQLNYNNTGLQPNQGQQYVLNVPLQFFHCRHDGLGLPLIALQYHEVRITFDIAPLNQLIVTNYANGGQPIWSSTPPNVAYASLWVDYIYLDQEERKRFAQATHEYLIEQVQYPSPETVTSTTTRSRLTFNHPCKFIVWNLQLARWTSGLRYLSYNSDDTTSMQLLATKRFILGYAALTSGGLQPNPLLNNQITAKSGLAGIWLAYFNNAGAVYVDQYVLDPDNVTITGTLLPLDVCSLDAATLEATVNAAGAVTRNTSTFSNQGSAVYDYVVYQWDNYGLQLDRTENPFLTGLLQLNGHDRFNIRDGDYFNYVQPYQCFTNTPSDGINVYSFALTPEEHQPSGTCNFSRIDNATLQITLGRALGEANISSSATFSSVYLASAATLNIYAFNYNVLRVMSGMAGLAYSN